MNNDMYAVDYRPGPSWIDGKHLADQPLHAHVDFWLTMVAVGRVVLAGPFRDGLGGLVVFGASSEQEADDIVRDDPAVRDGILNASLRGLDAIVTPAGRP